MAPQASTNALQAFNHIRRWLDGDGALDPGDDVPATELRSTLISHAVADEAHIIPVTDYLREYFDADLFICADSISPGTNWQETILSALERQAVFVLLLSQVTRNSLFCAFEIGVAHALGKPMLLISLDGSAPPPFIQHMQVIDLPRILRQKPWLAFEDVLLDEMLSGLAG